MTDRQFDVFLENTIKNFGEDYIDFSDGTMIQYTFSKKFEHIMAKLIRQQKNFYFPILKTSLRRTAIIIITVIIIISTMVMSVGALREVFLRFVTETFKTHTDVQTVDDPDAPENFEDIYAITNIPNGFEIDYQNEIIKGTPYFMTVYNKGQERIIFTQYIKSRYDVNINTEGYEMVRIDVNGHEGFMIDWGDDLFITWDNGDYIFEIDSNVSKDVLMSMANSVQKVE